MYLVYFLIFRIQRAWRSYLDRQKSKNIDRKNGNHGDVNKETLTDTEHNTTKRSNPFNIAFSEVGDTDYNLADKTNNDINVNDTACMVNPLNTEPPLPLVDNFLTHQAVQKSQTSNVKLVHSDILSPRQQRKNSLLSQAKLFVELKKLDTNILPFNLHMHLDQTDVHKSLTSGKEHCDRMSSDVMSPTSNDPNLGFGRKPCWDEDSESQEKGCETVPECGINSMGDNSDGDINSRGSNHVSCDKNIISESQKSSCDINTNSASIHSEVNSNSHIPKGSNSDTMFDSKTSNSDTMVDSKSSNSDTEQDDAFDVYNIETALPDMDWNSLEAKLKAASEEAQKIQEVSTMCTCSFVVVVPLYYTI